MERPRSTAWATHRLVTHVIDIVDRTLRRSQNVASDVHPSVGRTLATAGRYYAVSWVKVASVVGSIRYDAPIDPTRIYDVDPRRIDRTVTWTRVPVDKKANEHPRFRPPNYRLAGRVFDGDWDTIDARVTESTVYRSFVDHFEDDVPWEETRFYQESLEAIEAGGLPWGCTARSDLDERCARLDELYESIASEGYKTQDELYDGTGNSDWDRVYRVIWGEISINVGRDGEFIFQDGRKRLAMARILDLETVPVVILVRHEQWQRLRDRIARGEVTASDVSEDLRTHPDLVDLFRHRPAA